MHPTVKRISQVTRKQGSCYCFPASSFLNCIGRKEHLAGKFKRGFALPIHLSLFTCLVWQVLLIVRLDILSV